MRKNNLKIARIVFIVTILLLLSLHDIVSLVIATFVLWSLNVHKIVQLTLRVIKSVFFFNMGVSLGYVIMSLWQHVTPWEYLITINLKVYVLTYFVFLFFELYSIVQIMDFSKDLGYMTTIALSQIVSYRKSFEDFRLAFVSRGLRLRDKHPKFIAHTFEFFLDKTIHDANERTLAMKARGFFS